MKKAERKSIKYKYDLDDEFAILSYSNEGVNSMVLSELMFSYGVSRNVIAEELFDMSVKTMSRYENDNRKLSPKNSELALRLLALLDNGIEVFGSNESFRTWLKKPSIGLGNEIPISILNTSTGINLVKDELKRIEFGALA